MDNFHVQSINTNDITLSKRARKSINIPSLFSILPISPPAAFDQNYLGALENIIVQIKNLFVENFINKFQSFETTLTNFQMHLVPYLKSQNNKMKLKSKIYTIYIIYSCVEYILNSIHSKQEFVVKIVLTRPSLVMFGSGNDQFLA